MRRVSVVIPVYNQANLIGRTLESLVAQTSPPFEVVVVDDGSSDGIPAVIEKARSECPWTLTFIQADHGGPGQARQKGWQAATGDIIAFTDADAIPEPTWLEEAVLGFSSDQVGAVEGAIVTTTYQATIRTHQVRNLTGGHFMTANMLYRRSVIEEVGGFRLPYREDSDLAFSVLEHGYTIPFRRESVVSHPPRDESLGFYFKKANRKRYEGQLFRYHPKTAPIYLPRFQPTELLIVAGDVLLILAIVFASVWLLALGFLSLSVGLPKRLAAWLEGRQYSSKDYLLSWALSLVLVPVEAFYHWWGILFKAKHTTRRS